MLSGLQEAIERLSNKLQYWASELVLIFPNLIIAIIVLVIASYSTAFVKKNTKLIVSRFSHNTAVNNLFSGFVAVVYFLVALFLALNIMHLDKTVTSLLAGAGVAGLAIGLAFQDPLINTISGVMMSTKEPYQIGDLVETNGFMGYIKSLSLRFTSIETFDGQIVTIPNKLVIQKPLINYSILGRQRVVFTCGVPYNEDLEKVQEVIQVALEKYVDHHADKPIEVLYTNFGESSIQFRVHVWMDLSRQDNYLIVRSDAIKALKKGFDQNNISIPFPIRTLDFGIQGGEKLSTALKQVKGFRFDKASSN